MLPSWLKTVLIVGGIVLFILTVVILCLFVRGADMRRRKPSSEENSDGGKASQIKNDKRDPL